MSILSSLFGTKKRAKKSPSTSSTSPTSPKKSQPSSSSRSTEPSSSTATFENGSPSNNVEPGKKAGPSRYLSLKARSSIAPYDASSSQRKSSMEISRKRRSLRMDKDKGSEWELPNFEFGESGKDKGLGLGDVGIIPTLNDDEKNVLREIKVGLDDLEMAWMKIGGALKYTGKYLHGLACGMWHG